MVVVVAVKVPWKCATPWHAFYLLIQWSRGQMQCPLILHPFFNDCDKGRVGSSAGTHNAAWS
eukprot:9385795-Ditylum_brightwellii.AAC.1